MFVNDQKKNNGGNRVKFDSTHISHSFSWKTIIDSPPTFMFFGAPLNRSCNLDCIFRNIRSTAINGIKAMIEQQSNIVVGEERGELNN